MKILGIAGSLRRGSYNRALIEAARELAPPGMRIEPLDLDDIPLYNADFDAHGLRPAEVQRLKHGVAGADGVLTRFAAIATGAAAVVALFPQASRIASGQSSATRRAPR